MKVLKNLTAMAMAAVFFFAACKKEDSATPAPGNNPGNPQQPQPQSFNVRMTDAPGDFQALNMKVIRVDAWLEGSGWVNLDAQQHSMNVLSLNNGTEMQLAAKTQAQTGVYTKLKMTFDADASLQLNAFAMADVDGASIITDNLVRVEWDGPKEIEVAINKQVTTTAGAQVLLDFNVAQSMMMNARKYFIHPVITEMQHTTTGIKGSVQGTATAAVIMTDGQNTYSTYINAQGQFMLRGVKPGTYRVIVHRAKRVMGEMNQQPKEISGVVVAEGEMKQMGQISME